MNDTTNCGNLDVGQKGLQERGHEMSTQRPAEQESATETVPEVEADFHYRKLHTLEGGGAATVLMNWADVRSDLIPRINEWPNPSRLRSRTEIFRDSSLTEAEMEAELMELDAEWRLLNNLVPEGRFANSVAGTLDKFYAGVGGEAGLDVAGVIPDGVLIEEFHINGIYCPLFGHDIGTITAQVQNDGSCTNGEIKLKEDGTPKDYWIVSIGWFFPPDISRDQDGFSAGFKQYLNRIFRTYQEYAEDAPTDKSLTAEVGIKAEKDTAKIDAHIRRRFGVEITPAVKEDMRQIKSELRKKVRLEFREKINNARKEDELDLVNELEHNLQAISDGTYVDKSPDLTAPSEVVSSSGSKA